MFITRRFPLFLFEANEAGIAGQAPTVETPESTANTPEGTGTDQTAQTNWEDRYKEAQSWGTRNAQRVAELERHEQLINAWNSEDPEAQKWAAEQLGIQLDEEPPAKQGQYAQLDPEERKLLEEVKQYQTQQQQTQQQQQQDAAYRALTDPQLTQMGVPEGLHDIVAEAALGLPAIQTPQGPAPDLQGALKQVEAMAEHFAALPAVQTAVKKSWQRTKPTAAMTQPGGVQATHTPQLDTRAKKADWIAQQLAQLDADDQTGA